MGWPAGQPVRRQPRYLRARDGEHQAVGQEQGARRLVEEQGPETGCLGYAQTTWLVQAATLASDASDQRTKCNLIRFGWASCMNGLPFAFVSGRRAARAILGMSIVLGKPSARCIASAIDRSMQSMCTDFEWSTTCCPLEPNDRTSSGNQIAVHSNIGTHTHTPSRHTHTLSTHTPSVKTSSGQQVCVHSISFHLASSI